jgi:serine/threonine protein kinase/pimeloyl-ACP methyl ester carboxylesterase
MSQPYDRLAGALAGRYAVERELGQGSMATVYLARDLRHARQVAIKVLRPELVAVTGGDRFLREIRTIANLQHPHILGLIDSGEVDGTAYYVMPYVEGQSLRHRLNQERQLPIADAVRISCEVAEALDYAHRHGVVHRDIKPENILLHEGRALVADFGIALAVSSDSATRMSETRLMLGTPHYMSPEQALGEREVTARSDIYALGAMTYEMLVGEPPFTGPTAQAIVGKVITQKPTPLGVRRDTVPEAIEAAVLTALQKLPADRFATAADFGAALSRTASNSSGPAGATSSARTVATDRALTTGTFQLSENTCRRLTRAAFDPRLIGSEMSYLDNGVSSDVLVCYIAACGRGGDQFIEILRQSKYRSVAPTFRGFEPVSEWRPVFSIDDHIVLVRECLREIATRLAPRLTVIAGFSSGGDFALRLAAAPDPDARLRLDGCLTLSANLSYETCFLTSALASLDGNDEASLLAILRRVTERASSLDEWVNICEYVTRIVPVFRRDATPLRAFSAGISAPFEREPLIAFANWYCAATTRGCHVRCVFEDTAMYRNLVRELQLSNLDHGLLGDRYEELSVVSEAGTNHFDLIDPPTAARHLETLVSRLRQKNRAIPR